MRARLSRLLRVCVCARARDRRGPSRRGEGPQGACTSQRTRTQQTSGQCVKTTPPQRLGPATSPSLLGRGGAHASTSFWLASLILGAGHPGPVHAESAGRRGGGEAGGGVRECAWCCVRARVAARRAQGAWAALGTCRPASPPPTPASTRSPSPPRPRRSLTLPPSAPPPPLPARTRLVLGGQPRLRAKGGAAPVDPGQAAARVVGEHVARLARPQRVQAHLHRGRHEVVVVAGVHAAGHAGEGARHLVLPPVALAEGDRLVRGLELGVHVERLVRVGGRHPAHERVGPRVALVPPDGPPPRAAKRRLHGGLGDVVDGRLLVGRPLGRAAQHRRVARVRQRVRAAGLQVVAVPPLRHGQARALAAAGAWGWVQTRAGGVTGGVG